MISCYFDISLRVVDSNFRLPPSANFDHPTHDICHSMTWTRARPLLMHRCSKSVTFVPSDIDYTFRYCTAMGVEAIADQPAPYDFGVSSRLSREAVVGLKRIHATAADELEVLLSRSFGKTCRLERPCHAGALRTVCRCCPARLISLPHGIRISRRSVPSSVRP